MKKIVIGVLITVLLFFLVIQLLPLGKQHTNPPVLQEPAWDSQQTRQLAQRACFDCHSNETVWPWYGTVAPVSWLITMMFRRTESP
jgi:mono/diheme cytochrome c family protein